MRLKSGRSPRESETNSDMNRDEDITNASRGKTSTTFTTHEKKEGTVEDGSEQHPQFAVTLLEKHQEQQQQQQQQQNDLTSPPPTKGQDEKPNEMSRARRKKNEAIAVVSELYRLHEVGKKTNFRVTQEGLYQTMVELVNNISARVEKSNMVQMWVPRIAGKSVVMTTHGELCKISAKKKTHDSVLAKKFTENTTAFFFNCEVTNGEGMLGLPGRCYVLSRPEFTPSVTSYRPMEYVRVACAYECRIHTTMCLPVFLSEEAMKSERPFTILEVALCHMTESIGELYAATAHEFMKLGLFTTGHDRVGPERYMRKFIESTVETLAPGHANALELMCETLNVPFAQFWIESNGLIVTAGCPYFVKEKECQSYRDMSSQISLMIGQGPVGQAHSKETLIWVDDVQKASQIEWPLHHTSILLGLRGLCACKMRIDCVLPDGTKKKTDAILEILLNPKLQTSAEQIQTVEEVWSYLQRGVRVDNTKNAPDGASAPAVPDSPLAATAGVRGNDEQPASMLMELPDLTGKNNNTDTTREGKNNDDKTGKGKGAAPMTTLQAVEHISMVNKGPDEKNKTSAPWGITLELLQTQFSKHLKDAATDLGVGSTTLKRICRQYGIGRWPRRSLKSKQYKAMKEAAKQQSSQNKLRKARSSGGHSSGGSPRDGGSSFKSSGGDSDAVAGESVHGPGGRMSGGGSLSNLAKTGDGSPLGDGLFTMGSTGGAPIRGKEGSGGVGALLGSGEEGRSHGGFQAFRGIATQGQFDWGDEEERERGASWHAGSGFVSHGRLKNAKGQIVASGSQHGGHTASQFFGAQQHQQPHQSMPIAPAMQQGDFGPAAEKAETKTPNKKYKKDVAVGTKAGAGKAAVPFSFDDHFYETVHGAHNFSQQLYPHQYNNNDDSVHGSTYSESAHGGSHYNGGSMHGNPGGDHSVHGTTALAGILNNTLGGFDDDLFIANDTMEEADADMMAILLNEGEKVEEVPQLVVKFRVGADTIRFRLLHKWSVQMLLDRIRKLIVFPDSAKLKYMDDEDDMCILQSEHDLDECIKFTEHRKKESGNSGNNKSATNDPVVIGESNAQNNARQQQQQQQQQKQELLATGFAPNKPNGGEITIFICLADGSMPSLNAYELIKQDIHSIPPSLSASVNARRDQLTINVKVTHDNDTCRFLLEPKMNHVTLMEHVLKLFGIQKETSSSSHYHRLTYLDDSEEWITLAGDLDLDECRALCGCSPSLRMKLLDR